jgi:hypothetical protein
MELVCHRKEYLLDATIGHLFVDGEFICYTLEDKVREIKDQPVECWKVDGKTAIPYGRYKVTLENSNRFGPDTLTLNDVHGFTSIRVHAGNTHADTEGCPLVGMAFQGEMISSSKKALEKLKAKVFPVIQSGVEVWWTAKAPA